ncbi:MAG: hypothetical protein ACRDGM_05600, partial [bacterium]
HIKKPKEGLTVAVRPSAKPLTALWNFQPYYEQVRDYRVNILPFPLRSPQHGLYRCQWATPPAKLVACGYVTFARV